MTIGTFRYQGVEMIYLHVPYNRSAQNMRTVEIPIARYYLARYPRPATIIEVGNVLSHYGPIDWPVVDACERAPWVINADVMAWQPSQCYDLVISISTLEHIGYGRYASLTRPTSPSAIIARLRSWLTPGGLLMATIPTRYHPRWDTELRCAALGRCRLHPMRRISDDNEWAECSLEEALAMPYTQGKHRWGGGMVVILAEKETG